MSQMCAERRPCGAANSSAIERERRAGGLADAEREVAGLAAHRDDHVPAARRAGVLGTGCAPASAPTWRAVWKPKVGMWAGSGRSLSMVFGTCAVRMRCPVRAVDVARRQRGVVAADRDEVGDAQLLQRRRPPRPWSASSLGRVVARGAEHRAAGEVDARHVVDRELADVTPVAPHQPAEAVLDAEDAEAAVARLDGRRRDDGVDARRGPATDEDSELSSRRHGAAFASAIALIGAPRGGSPDKRPARAVRRPAAPADLMRARRRRIYAGSAPAPTKRASARVKGASGSMRSVMALKWWRPGCSSSSPVSPRSRQRRSMSRDWRRNSAVSAPP